LGSVNIVEQNNYLGL